MKPTYLWESISRAGIPAGFDKELARKVILCNQIGFSVGVALFLGASNHLAWGYTVLAPFMMVFSLLYFLVPYLNHRGFHNLSRLYLSFLPPCLVTLLAGLVLYRDPSFKFAVIPIILVPLLVFGITERIKMLAGIAWVVLAFLMLDNITPLIPRLQDITISDAEIMANAKVNGVITFAMFSVSFVYLQKLNQKAERALSESLREVQAQKEIIEQQKREEQEQALLALAKQREVNALKSTFVAMTSHEFRTPLSAILSAQELLRDFGEKVAAPERAELFIIIESAVQRMTGMLDKILILGQADADMMEFKPAPVNIVTICHQIIDEVKQSSGKATTGIAKIGLRTDLASGEAAHLDENLLHHFLGNLLSNAVKYSPDGGEAVLAVSRLPDAIRFEVIDQGIGIPEEDLPRLFESFHRASNVGGIPGTGLGLAVAMKAVERHGGTIAVASKMGEGTRFSISLPQG
jgi:signal transduction histidine kinase